MISPHDHIPGGLAHHDRLPLLHHVLRCLLLRQELLRQDVEIMFFFKNSANRDLNYTLFYQTGKKS